MKLKSIVVFCFVAVFAWSCKDDSKTPTEQDTVEVSDEKFDFNVEQFADIKILRYQIPGWDNLSLKEQKLVYYLTQAGLAGRDIMWDQNYRHNLKIRKALENVYTNYNGDKTSNDWKAFCKLSLNVLPIAITSPTDCICTPKIPLEVGNFSKSNLGILVTT